jgi:predicted phosphoribosyltransferase
VSERLHLPLDVVVVRKLGVPWQPELAFGAVTADTQLLDDKLIRMLGIPPEDIAEIVAREQAEIVRRETAYRHNRQPADLRGRGVILVDDGIATGSTMLAAVRHVRRMQPAKVTVAVPVASGLGLEKIRAEADDTVFAALPDRFFSVGEFYEDFPQVSDEEVRHLLLAPA